MGLSSRTAVKDKLDMDKWVPDSRPTTSTCYGPLASKDPDSQGDAVQEQAQQLTAQVTRLDRAITRAKEAWLFSDTPEEEGATLARLRDQLSQAQRKLDAAQVIIPHATESAGRLTDLAELPGRATTRLQKRSHERRGDLLTMLQIRILLNESVVCSEPRSFQIQGILRPEEG